MERRIEYSGNLTYNDYKTFQSRATHQIYLYGILLVILVLAVLFTNILSFYGRKYLDLLNIPVFLFLLFLLTKYQWKRNWQKTPFLHAKIHGSISEKGLEWRVGEEITGNISWDRIIKKELCKDIILLYTGPRQAYFIPHRFFNNETDWNEAIAFLKIL